MNIHIFGVYNAEWKPLFDLAGPLWEEYAKRHDFKLCLQDLEPVEGEQFTFTKTLAALEYSRDNKMDVTWVIDLDMIPTNMKVSMLDAVTVQGGSWPIAMGRDINGWNSGSYLVLRHAQSWCWLETVHALRVAFPTEQHAMKVINGPFAVREARGLNSIPYELYHEYGNVENEHYSQWKPGALTYHLPGRDLETRLCVLEQAINLIER